MQLDIFEHSRDVMLRHDVLTAIVSRQVSPGRTALAKLTAEYPDDPHLPTLRILIETLESPPDEFDNHNQALLDLNFMETVIQPTAERLLPTTKVRAWIADEWRIRAEAMADLIYNPASPQAHAAPCWLRAKEWNMAEDSIRAIPSWRRIPQPLTWMAEARHGREGIEGAWPFLVELAWLAPSRFDALANRLADLKINELLRDFNANFENEPATDSDLDDLAWFPAWSLIIEPSLMSLIRTTEPGLGQPPERAARILMEILTLEKQGSHHLLLEQRKKLRQLHAGLFDRYMRAR
jgi:hypothetical protein